MNIMKWIVLLSVICLSGLAAAQGMFTGEGYSSSQLAFYSGPNTSSFDSNVQQYWNNYVSGSGNATIPPAESPLNTMSIWQSTFSYKFEKPVALANTTFAIGDQGTGNLTTQEWNAIILKRATTFNFNAEQSTEFTQKSASQPTGNSSVSSDETSGNPTAESSGQVLSQGISMIFSS
jgi:hypothetical protein